MESLFTGLSQHGYLILFAAVLLEAIGIPVPAAIALLIAGAASAAGGLQLFGTVVTALFAMMLGDTLLFLMGRHTGWWLLGLLCRLSLNPESCILRSANSFHRRGRSLLIFAKFVPGINTMAPPLAGSMNMPLGQFLSLDLAGASLYVGAYLSIGFLFSGAIGTITNGYHAVGRVLSWAFLVAVATYLTFQLLAWRKSRGLSPVPFITPEDAHQTFSSGDALIYDVRSHGYYDRSSTRVRGAQRLDPNAIERWEHPSQASETMVFLYCTCVRDATSIRVTRLLLEKGARAAVIKGGFQAWKKAGLPLEQVPEEDIEVLPVFQP